MPEAASPNDVAEVAAPDWPGSHLEPPPKSGDPNVAFRARLNALGLDVLIVAVTIGVMSGVVAAILVSDGVPVRTFTGVVPELVISAVEGVLFACYMFAFEATRGRSPGKRVYHLRVVGPHGSPLTARQALIRNALRPIDALPGLYALGLVSILRTGRDRRQRIGDIAAGTTVVLDDNGTWLPTPNWLLPGLTVFAVVCSLASIVELIVLEPFASAVAPFRRPAPPPTTVRGGPPRSGAWVAIEGAADQPWGGAGGFRLLDAGHGWTIARSCDPRHRCTFTLTQQLTDGQSRTAPLVAEPQDWNVTFPPRLAACGYRSGHFVRATLHSEWALWFTDHGRKVNARDQTSVPTAACRYLEDDIAWTASLRSAGQPTKPPSTRTRG
jgi:uncharacterized RDD family membrane protein YckC